MDVLLEKACYTSDGNGGCALEFETIIGLEVHAQLLTRSKMFCGCSADYVGAEPNTHVCPVCLGLPGALPVINRQAVRYTIMTGLALNCQIPAYSKFDRKNYMYPDLMKGYQISQYDLPLCVNGYLEYEHDGVRKRVGIRRVHLEEDTAKLVHANDGGVGYSLVDVNRAGVPLIEIVTEPDLRSPEEARAFLMALRQVLRYLGVSTANMEEGAFRCDANISQRTRDGSIIGPKVEIKNMNSFRSVERALAYEVERQRAALQRGEQLIQETRGWLEDQGMTVSQRTKEYAEDYRYFPEPDLPPLFLTEAEVAEIRAEMPELPLARWERFQAEYGLSPQESALLTEEREVADFFEACLQGDRQRAKAVANWITGPLFALMRERGLSLSGLGIRPEQLRQLVTLVENGTINALTAKDVLEAVCATGKDPETIVAEQGLAQVSDVAQLRAVVQSVLEQNPKAVADYRRGKSAALGFLLGQVMKALGGRANPAVARELLEEALQAPVD